MENEPMSETRRYLGDAVYVAFDGFMLTLTTGHHDEREASNVIHLEPATFEALKRFVEQLKPTEGTTHDNRT